MKTAKYLGSVFNIGLISRHEVWLLVKPFSLQIQTEHYRGALVFRIPGTSRCFVYKRVKQGLRPFRIQIKEESLPL